MKRACSPSLDEQQIGGRRQLALCTGDRLGTAHIGIKVDVTGLDIPDTDTYVMVEWISYCYKVSDNLFRVIRVRRQEDIQIIH